MLTYPDIDPVAFTIGPLSVYWYGVSYLAGFLGAYLVSISRGKKQVRPWSGEQVADLLFYVALGVIFGGRIGFILLYQPEAILEEPLALLQFWARGRSFHGGLLGVVLTVLIYSRLQKRTLLEITDFIAPVVPIGLGFGRLGNFINGELWGRITDVPWGMVFPFVSPEPRHPSQLYEFALEGVLLFAILMLYAAKPRKPGAISGMFLICYGIFRCLVELVREPDQSHGFIAFNWLTMGQLFSIPMIFLGIFLLIRRKHLAT
jgi:phosphatidylglycerol:prolipoprotein diacylglycerol transferase